MPTVTRRARDRRRPASGLGAWSPTPPPAALVARRWQRVEDALARRPGPAVFRSPKGKPLRADFTRVERGPPSAGIAWRQELEESPFERIMSPSRSRAWSWRPRGRCHAGRAPDAPEAARAVRASADSWCGRATRRAAGRGAGRASRGSHERRALSRACAGGAGARTGPRGRCRPAALAMLRAELGVGAEHTAAPSRSRRCACPSPRCPTPRAGASAGGRGRGNVRDDRLARVSHACGRSYPDLVRLRAGDGGARPTPWSIPARHARSRRVLAACAEAGRGGGALRRRHQRGGRGGAAARRHGGRVSLDLARMDGLIGSRPPLAHRHVRAGLRGPRAGGCAARAGPDARALPAVASSSRPSAAWWPRGRQARRPRATAASTSWCAACACATPAGRVGRQAVPATAAGPVAARAGGGLGGRARA